MTTIRETTVLMEEGRTSRRVRAFTRVIKQKRLGTFGGLICLTMIICGGLAGIISPYGMNEIIRTDRFAPISTDHLLGADHLGRDLLSRLLYGARLSLFVGLSATTLCVFIAVFLGVPSGYIGGKLDIIVQRFVDAWMAFPGLLVLLTVLSITGRGMIQIIIVLGVLFGIHNSRIVRSAVISIKEDDYFIAAKAIGSPASRILKNYIMPNIMAPVIIVFSVNIGWIILDEAALSFLGYGLPPENASWGTMLSSEGRRYMEVKPVLALYPGICLAVLIYGINVFGDAVRDLLDPRLRGSN